MGNNYNSEIASKDCANLQELLKSPGWSLFCKLANNLLESSVSSIINETEQIEVFRLQGRIQCIRQILTMPEHEIASLEKQTRKG